MTLPVQVPLNTYVGNGVATSFAYTFLLLQAAELMVRINGALQVLGTHYSVAGLGNVSGGTVTFLVAPANGAQVLIRRDTTLSRTTHYTGGDLPADTLNADMNRVWMRLQDETVDVLHALRAPSSDPIPAELPAVAARANRFAAFDSGGNMFGASGAVTGTPVSPFAATLLDDADAATARATLGAMASSGMSTIAAAATLPLAAAANEVEISGNNVTITGIDVAPAGAVRTCRVTGTGIVLAHSGTFQLAGNANVALDQFAQFRVRSLGGGTWTCSEIDQRGSLPMLQSGGTMTGPVTLHADPTLALHASTRQFVLAQSAMTLLQTQSFGSVGSVNFVNLTGFRSYIFMLENVFPGTDGADLCMRVSSNNGASWFIAHGDYTSSGIRHLVGASAFVFGANPWAYIRLLDFVRNSAGVTGQITWSGFNVAGTHKRATALLTGLLNDGNVHWASSSGSLISSAVALNGVQFLTGSGNFGAGTISCYGIRG